MRQIKIFQVQTINGNEFAELESQVNQWLSDHGDSADVHQITPSTFPTAMAITIDYYTSR